MILKKIKSNLYALYINTLITEFSNFTKIEKASSKADVFDSGTPTFSYVSAIKSGNVVSLSFLTNAISTTASNWYTIGTLKSKFCPDVVQNLQFVNNSNGSSIQVNISTAGVVKIWTSTALSSVAVGGSCTYMHE